MRNRKWNFSHQTFPENTTVSHFDCLFGFKFLQFCFIPSSHADTNITAAFTTTILFHLIVFLLLVLFFIFFISSYSVVYFERLYLGIRSEEYRRSIRTRSVLTPPPLILLSNQSVTGFFLCFFFLSLSKIFSGPLYLLCALCLLCSVQCRCHASHSGTCTSFDFVINVKRSL